MPSFHLWEDGWRGFQSHCPCTPHAIAFHVFPGHRETIHSDSFQPVDVHAQCNKKIIIIKSTSVIKETNKEIHQPSSPGFSNKEKTESQQPVTGTERPPGQSKETEGESQSTSQEAAKHITEWEPCDRFLLPPNPILSDV